MKDILIWLIGAGTIAGILLRPKEWPEAVWACLGAALLVVFGLLSLPQAGEALLKGTGVYLFLTGMMLLSELARREGVFDWMASLAVRAAKGSPVRLFLLVYLVGTVVTIFLSNDATAVVLTPAVYAAVKKAGTKALPYLLICAFTANAASFVLPISNPANLVVYGKHLPALIPWLRTFLMPSLLSIVATYAVLRFVTRKDLQGKVEDAGDDGPLSSQGRFAAWGIAATGAVLIGASGFGLDLGLPTLVSAAIVVLLVSRARAETLREVFGGVSWSVLPLVGGLFVLVEALNSAGALRSAGDALRWCAQLPVIASGLAASFGIAGLSNVMNNLPSGLLAGGALQTVRIAPHIRDSVLVGVDLGPNFSVTGSLATVLWLIVLRREGEKISGSEFLKVGALVMPPALFLSTIAVSLLSR